MITSPYLLYLGSSDDEAGIKTSRGLAVFRNGDCVGEFRHDDCRLTLNLTRMDFKEAVAAGARTLVLGIANAGGRLDKTLARDAIDALEAGLDFASGLHQRLRDMPRIAAAAARLSRNLHDVRDAPPIFKSKWQTPVRSATADCRYGLFGRQDVHQPILGAWIEGPRDRCELSCDRADGILIAGGGVPLDAVVADFISGAIEQLSPARDDDGWDVIEGQGSLFHPSFAGVSTGLLHGAQPAALIMCHDPVRQHMRWLPHYPMPNLAEVLTANLKVARLTSPDVQAVGVALNNSKLPRDEAERLCDEVSSALNLPCTDPFCMSVDPIIDWILECFEPLPHVANLSH